MGVMVRVLGHIFYMPKAFESLGWTQNFLPHLAWVWNSQEPLLKLAMVLDLMVYMQKVLSLLGLLCVL